MITNAFWVMWDFYIGEYAQGTLFLAYFYLAVKGFFSWKDEPVSTKT